MTQSNWQAFIKDFGDAIGGTFIGYSIGTANKDIWYGVVGVVLVLTSIYIRFYTRKKES